MGKGGRKRGGRATASKEVGRWTGTAGGIGKPVKTGEKNNH